MFVCCKSTVGGLSLLGAFPTASLPVFVLQDKVCKRIYHFGAYKVESNSHEDEGYERRLHWLDSQWCESHMCDTGLYFRRSCIIRLHVPTQCILKTSI